MNRFGIIQLSDLQFGKNHRFGNPSTIAEKLLNDIKKMSGEHDFAQRYIVLSGDITERAHSEEFTDATNAIEEILSSLDINRTNILCVPGNHDVNWDLADNSKKAGDDQLKFQPYNSFVSNITSRTDEKNEGCYPKIRDRLDLGQDSSINIEFLLLNSCEKIDRENNSAWICKRKLNESITSQKEKGTLRIVISHHLVHALAEGEIKEATKTEEPVIPKQSLQKRVDAIDNMKEIKSIVENHKCDIVLTGHMHEPHLEPSKNNEGHSIIYCGCGSTGVNSQHRGDGVPNQYCIHIIDFDENKFHNIWRAYYPLRQTKLGLGEWDDDTSITKKPITSFSISVIKQKEHEVPQKEMKSMSSSEYVLGSKTDKDKMKLAFLNLLGGWKENG